MGKKVKGIVEGNVKKGGTNEPPKSARPAPPKSQKLKKKQLKKKTPEAKKYHVSVIKGENFDFNEIMEWIKLDCKGKFYFRRFKKNVVFTFFSLDDGLKFKFRWEVA